MTAPPVSATASRSRPVPVFSTGPLSAELLIVTGRWAESQHQIVTLAADFADSGEWLLAGSPSPAHWLAAVAGVEASTAREWVRIGRRLRELPASADAYARGALSYSKIRALTRIATPENEAELVAIARDTPAGDLPRALAAWLTRTSTSDELERHQHRQRSVRWRTEPDGMVVFTLRLPPLTAARLIVWLTKWVMTSRRPRSRPTGRPINGQLSDASADASTVAQQHADAIGALVAAATKAATATATATAPAPASASASGHAARPGRTETDGDAHQIDTELVIHVRGDGCSFDDGTPISGSIVEALAPTSFLRVLVHDAERRPINASGRQRHPTARQKRVVKERDQVCRDCGRAELLQHDHVPDYEISRHTVIDELELRCAPCHQRRHAA